jgi:hypothetical protein
MNSTLLPLLLAEFTFEKQATTPILWFQGLVLIGSVIGCWILSRLVDKLWLRLLATGAAVLIFELFTGPMWINERMGPWAYLYLDLSWVLTVGWSVLILGVVVLIDKFLPGWNQVQRFAAYLAVLLVLVVILEIIVVNLGIRSYSPEVLASTCGVKLLGPPIEVLFYVPVFTSLIITFYKYWSFVIDDKLPQSRQKRKWGRAIVITFTAVFLFEVMIEPMIENRNFPAWSYVYHDISILLTGSWVLLLAAGAVASDWLFARFPVPLRFAAAVLTIGLVALVIESWMLMSGYRVYGPSMEACFTGFRTPITNIPSEISFAIVCYLSLIIAFIRFWEVVLDKRV